MIRKIIIASLWLVGLNAMAQVSLEDCQKWARENYPEVKRFGIIDATEVCNLSNAAKNWLPMVNLGIQGGWMNNTADVKDLFANLGEAGSTIYEQLSKALNIKPVPNWQYRAGVEVVQPIYDGGATALQQEMVRRQAEAERAKIEVSLHTLEEKVLDVYFAILLLEDRKEQVALRSELLDKNIEKLRNLEKEGIARLIDVENIEVEQLKLKQASDVIDENIDIYRTTLSLLTGQNVTEQELVRPTAPTAARPAFSSQAEMQLLEKESELLSLKSRYEHVKMMPKLGLMGQAYYGYPGNNVFRDLVKHTPQLNLGIGLKLSWDLSPLYKRKNNLTNLRLEQETLENHRELLLFRQRITNTSLETRVKRLESIRQQDDRIVELRQKLRIAEEAKVDNDIIDATELLAKIDDEADAKLQRSIHETEMMRDIYKLMIYGDTEK